MVPEVNGPVYVIDCEDFANPTSKLISVRKSEKKSISVLQMLQIPPNMTERFTFPIMDSSDIEYRFVNRMFMESKGAFNFQVVSINRLYNQSVQERFRMELKLMARKYPKKQPTQIVKLLFHGAKAVQPEHIYTNEEGLDMRFSRAGYYGQGIYFADNSNYSHAYAYSDSNQVFSMFLVFVIVGRTVKMAQQDNTLRMPPLLPGSQVDRYDSVMNGTGDHTIIYSNSR